MSSGYIRRSIAVLRAARAVKIDAVAPPVIVVPTAESVVMVPVIIVSSTVPPSSVEVFARLVYDRGIRTYSCYAPQAVLRVCKVDFDGDSGYVEIYTQTVGVLARVAVVRVLTLDVLGMLRGGVDGKA